MRVLVLLVLLPLKRAFGIDLDADATLPNSTQSQFVSRHTPSDFLSIYLYIYLSFSLSPSLAFSLSIARILSLFLSRSRSLTKGVGVDPVRRSGRF